MRPFLPPAPFRGTLLLRVGVVWAVLRAVALSGMGGLGASIWMTPAQFLAGTPWVVLVLVVAVRIDTERRGEAVFLANLGYGFRHLAGLTAALGLVLDVVLAVALAAGAARAGA